jgi:hypothetical protein
VLPSRNLTGTIPTELGTLTMLTVLCVRCPHPTRLVVWPSPCGLSAAVARGCRALSENNLTGTVPTQLGMLTALTFLCVRLPHQPRLHECAVTGLWAERGGGVGMDAGI